MAEMTAPSAKWRAITGVVGGTLITLSSGAHSMLGWPSVRQELTSAGVGGDLLFGMQAGWQFGGAAMLVTGVTLVILFARRVRGAAIPTFPGLITGAGYLAFGLWALLAHGFNPFFFVFIVPALLLLVASTG
jgi:hypothetical protein